jgi:hypothetical protein
MRWERACVLRQGARKAYVPLCDAQEMTRTSRAPETWRQLVWPAPSWGRAQGPASAAVEDEDEEGGWEEDEEDDEAGLRPDAPVRAQPTGPPPAALHGDFAAAPSALESFGWDDVWVTEEESLDYLEPQPAGVSSAGQQPGPAVAAPGTAAAVPIEVADGASGSQGSAVEEGGLGEGGLAAAALDGLRGSVARAAGAGAAPPPVAGPGGGGGGGSANALLCARGPVAVADAVAAARPVHVPGLMDLESVFDEVWADPGAG